MLCFRRGGGGGGGEFTSSPSHNTQVTGPWSLPGGDTPVPLGGGGGNTPVPGGGIPWWGTPTSPARSGWGTPPCQRQVLPRAVILLWIQAGPSCFEVISTKYWVVQTILVNVTTKMHSASIFSSHNNNDRCFKLTHKFIVTNHFYTEFVCCSSCKNISKDITTLVHHIIY